MKKLVVISGGTKGIGKAIALKFQKEGYEVAVCARNIEGFKEEHPSIYSFKADVSKKEEVEAFAHYVLGLQLPIAALVNNAGVFIPGSVLGEEDGILEKQINTNVYSAYYLTRSLIGELRKAESAHIFNICSVASIMAHPGSGSYSISKFAMLGFNKSLRYELKETSIKVTAILPGATLTESWAGVDLPESRFVQADDVADTVWAAYQLPATAVVEELVIRPQLGDI